MPPHALCRLGRPHLAKYEPCQGTSQALQMLMSSGRFFDSALRNCTIRSPFQISRRLFQKVAQHILASQVAAASVKRRRRGCVGISAAPSCRNSSRHSANGWRRWTVVSSSMGEGSRPSLCLPCSSSQASLRTIRSPSFATFKIFMAVRDASAAQLALD